MNYVLQNYASILNVVGAAFEVVGVCLVGNRFVFNSPRWQIVFVLFSAFWRGEASKNAAGFSDISEENALTTLQGLSFIAFGFIIISIPNIVQLCCG
jgi:hypothetical protein